MKAYKIVHNNEDRIKIDFPYNQETSSKLRQITDARWSQTHKAWHIPDTRQALEQLKNLFPEIEYSQNVSSRGRSTNQGFPIGSKNSAKPDYLKQTGVSIMVLGRNIAIKLPKNESDTQFILSLRFSKWDGKHFCWTVPNYTGSLERIKEYFKDRITELIIDEGIEIKTKDNTQRRIDKSDLLIIKTNTGRLKVIFGFNKELTIAIKNIPYYSWDSQNKWWSIPFTEKFLEIIKVIAEK